MFQSSSSPFTCQRRRRSRRIASMRRTTETRWSGSGTSSSGRTRCSRSSQAGIAASRVRCTSSARSRSRVHPLQRRPCAGADRRGTCRPRGVLPRSDLVRFLAGRRERALADLLLVHGTRARWPSASSRCTQARRTGRRKGAARSRSCPTTRFGRRWTRELHSLPSWRAPIGRAPVCPAGINPRLRPPGVPARRS